MCCYDSIPLGQPDYLHANDPFGRTIELISGGPSTRHCAGFYPPSDPAIGSAHTLRFVEGSLKENTPVFKAKWRYHQSWDLRAGGFHSQWDSWIKANPEATREQILATMEQLRGAFPAGGIPDTP